MIRRILELALVIAAAWAALGGLIYLVMTTSSGEPAPRVVEVKKKGD